MRTDDSRTFLFESTPTPAPGLRRDLIASVIAGQIAGLAMATMLVTAFGLSPATAWYQPPQIIASALLGESAIGAFSLVAFVLGVLLHQAISLGWSLVFALVFNQVTPGWTMALVVGVGIGVLGQLLGVQILVRWEMELFHGRDLWAENVPFLWSSLAHLIFGASFVLFVPISAELKRVDAAERSADASVARRSYSPHRAVNSDRP